MQIKTTMRCPCILNKITKMKGQVIVSAGENAKQEDISYDAGENAKHYSHSGKQLSHFL